MTSFLEGARQGARAAACGLVTDGDLAQRLLDTVVPPGTSLNDAASLLRRQLCDQPPGEQPPPLGPPFPGGQCPFLYNWSLAVQVRVESDGSTVTVNRSGTATGPISVDVLNLPPPQLWRVEVRNGNGTLAGSAQGASSATTYLSYTLAPTPAGGQPDDCGDPPLEPVDPWPPGGIPQPVNIDYDSDGGSPVSEPVDVTIFAPQVNIDNDLVIPFTFSPTLNIDGSINVNTGDITINPQINLPGRGPGEIEGPPAAPEPPASNPEPDDDPELQLIRAVVISSNIEGNRKATELLYPGQPTTMAPRLGVVRFAIAAPGGSAIWSGDIPIKQTLQWIDCPSPYGATDVVASPDAGSGNIILSVRAIRGPSPWIAPRD